MTWLHTPGNLVLLQDTRLGENFRSLDSRLKSGLHLAHQKGRHLRWAEGGDHGSLCKTNARKQTGHTVM